MRPIHGIEIRQGASYVYGRSVLTVDILAAFLEGEAPAAIATRLRLTPEDVERAIRFEGCKACPCDACLWARSLRETEKEKDNGRGKKA